MKSVGAGAKEIRIHVLGEWRVLYVAKLSNAVMCSTHFRKKRTKRVKKILNWLVNVTKKSEAKNEK